MGLNIGLISEHELYKQLGTTRSARLLAYRSLFTQEVSACQLEEIQLHTNKERVIGHEIFIKQIEVALGRRVNQKNGAEIVGRCILEVFKRSES